MVRFYEADNQELIEKTAEELKKSGKITPPDWAAYVKTGTHKERPPIDSNWWYLRSASVLRRVAVRGPVGVAKLRTKYGGRKRRGHQPNEFRKASGNIIRKVLQQLQKAGYISYKKDGVHKGRVISPLGASFLDKAANACIPKHEKKRGVQAKEYKEQDTNKKHAEPKKEDSQKKQDDKSE